jgi:hypothetical protein
VGEEVERNRSGRDEKHPDPNGPVRQPVVDFVSGSKRAVAGKLNPLGVPVALFVGRRKNRNRLRQSFYETVTVVNSHVKLPAATHT